jgi:ABC-type multidrug transport system permease subunit
MFSLFQLLLKNFKILFRSKTATAAIFFGPIILVLLLGAAFNTAQLHGLKLAAYSPEQNNLSEEITNKLSSQFEIIKAASEQSCIEGVKSNEWHVCFVFPSNFSVEGNSTVDFYVNPTNINLVQTIVNIISVRVGEKSEEIRVALIESVMQKANAIESELTDHDGTIELLRKNIDSITSSMQAIEQKLASINLDVSSSQSKVTSLNTSLNKIRDANDKILDASNVSQEVEDASEDIDKAVNSSITLINELNTSINDTVDKVSKAKASSDYAKTEISAIKIKLGQMQTDLKNLEDSLVKVRENAKDIRAYSSSQIAQPITTDIHQITMEKSYLELILPFLIALLLLFGGVFLGSSIIVSEKSSKAYFRNFILPINRGMFVFSSYLTAIITILFQVGILFAVLAFVIKVPISGPLILMIFLLSSVFVLMGMAIGYASRTAETSVLITIVVILFILFFSNLVLPLETISYLKQVALYNPLTMATDSLKGISLLGLGFSSQQNTIIALAYYFAALLLLTLVMQEWSKRHV